MSQQIILSRLFLRMQKNQVKLDDNEKRQELIEALNNEIQRLNVVKQEAEQSQRKRIQQEISLFQLRLRLISKCQQFSLLRLTHLEQIFKHYSSHVFRIGKHMTFDRLEYDRVHMTLERFSLFLKDFQLTTAVIDGKGRQILETQTVITQFKKISSDARHLSFEQFIRLIQKVAVLFWNDKESFKERELKEIKRKEKLKKKLERIAKKRLKAKEPQKNHNKSSEQQGEVEQREEKDAEQKQQEKIEEQNDGLVDQLMNNQQITDPNEEVKAVAQGAKMANRLAEAKKQSQNERLEFLRKLTVEEKIQYFYTLVDVDSVQSYKSKLRALDLPLFLEYGKNTSALRTLSESKIQSQQQKQQERALKLRQKLNEKKQKFKDRPLPKPSNEQAKKQEENSKKRKELKKQREQSIKQTKIEEVKIKQKLEKAPITVQYKQAEVSWQMLQKLTIEQLKLKNFQPSKFSAPQEDDRYYLQQYGARPKVASRLKAREKMSLSIAESTRNRAKQLETIPMPQGPPSQKNMSRPLQTLTPRVPVGKK